MRWIPPTPNLNEVCADEGGKAQGSRPILNSEWDKGNTNDDDTSCSQRLHPILRHGNEILG